jgi:hypothetical protein
MTALVAVLAALLAFVLIVLAAARIGVVSITVRRPSRPKQETKP